MISKRPSVRYGATPEPVTPYQKAAQVWDERIGAARVQAKNWRIAALGSTACTTIAVIGMAVMANQPRVAPYVVEVADTGAVRVVGAAARDYDPTDAQVAYHLSRFVTKVRSLSTDPIVVRQNWLDAYEYVTDRAARTLNDYALRNDPFAEVGEKTVTVEVVSVVRASPSSFQLRWNETTHQNGAFAGQEPYSTILTIVRREPRNELDLAANPLGIFVDAFDWSRDFTTGETR